VPTPTLRPDERQLCEQRANPTDPRNDVYVLDWEKPEEQTLPAARPYF
jgi:hypothetical protein